MSVACAVTEGHVPLLTTDANGVKTSEMRYNPWGAVRYAWTPDLAPGLPSRYTFTGQYSYMDDPTTSASEGFGLMFYNARWYDVQLGRFAQADSIIPGVIQGLDRYAYVYNNPIRYSDPSGHIIAEPEGSHVKRKPFVISFQSQDDTVSWLDSEKQTINDAALWLGGKFAQIINHDSFLDYKMGILDGTPVKVSAADAFVGVFGGQVKFKKVCQTCAEYHMSLPNPPEDASEYTCWGRNIGGNTIYTFRNAPAEKLSSVFQWGIHEIFHAFDNLTGNTGRAFAESYNRSIFDSTRGWQQSRQIDSWEIFADMGIAWTYSHWSSTSKDAPAAAANMSEFMQMNILNLYYQP